MQSIHSAASQISCSLSKDQQRNQKQKGCAKSRESMNVQPITKIWLLFSFFTSFLVQYMSWSLGNENDRTQREAVWLISEVIQPHAVDTVHLLLNLCLHSSHAVAFLGLDLCLSCPQSVCAHDGLAAHPGTLAAGWRSACSQRWEANSQVYKWALEIDFNLHSAQCCLCQFPFWNWLSFNGNFEKKKKILSLINLKVNYCQSALGRYSHALL